MNFDILCINTTHNLYSKADKLPEGRVTAIVHVTNCKCECGAVMLDNPKCRITCVLKLGHEGKHGWEK